jgi:hypothetical protein
MGSRAPLSSGAPLPSGTSVASRDPVPTAGSALRGVVADRVSRVLFAGLSVVITVAYSVTLPFAFTQRLSVRNWQFLTPMLGVFAVALGLGMAFLLTVQVHAFRRAAAVRRASGDQALSGFALLVSLLPTFLCCTPVIPTVLATFGLSAISVYSTTRSLQGFFEIHQTAFVAASLVLLALTAWWSLRRVARAECLTPTGCELPR